MLLCFSGLRVGELCALNRADVDVKHRKAYVWAGKGKKDRLVFFNQLTADDIKNYLDSRRDKAKPLFLDQYGNRVSVRCIEWTIKKYAPVSDISPHRLRAYFATMCINRDVPINAVKEYMGHENIKTTMRYISMSDEYLRREYDKGIE
jgi:integrase